MIPIQLVVAIVVIAVVCVGNVMLTFTLLRRIRQHEMRFAGRMRPGGPVGAESLRGRVVPDFEVVTTTGERVTRESFLGRRWSVGFFSAACAPCHQQAALFGAAVDPDRVAVVSDFDAASGDVTDLVAHLAGTPAVVVESAPDGLAERMGVRSFPSIVRVDEAGVVVAAASSMTAFVASIR